MAWLSRVFRFDRIVGRDVLEVGCGAGYDAITLASRGGEYVGVDITPENIDRTRSHLDLMGLQGEVQLVDAESLPFGDNSFDVYFSNGVLHHVPSITAALSEAFRVLRPGGEAWITVYHRNSAFYWLTLYLQHWWLLGDRDRHESFADRVAMIEYTTADQSPIVNVYSRSSIEALVRTAGFGPVRSCVRKLVHVDLPYGDRWPIRAIPQRVLDVYAQMFGWYVAIRAIKPQEDAQAKTGRGAIWR